MYSPFQEEVRWLLVGLKGESSKLMIRLQLSASKTLRNRYHCTGVEMFRKLLDQGQAGDNVGVLLRGTKREEVERGQVLAKPGSITPAHKV